VVRAAFADFSSPGRLQVVSREPLTILDAATGSGLDEQAPLGTADGSRGQGGHEHR
jgi:hypothetical protein